MPGIKTPFFFFFILALLITPFPAMGLEYPVKPAWEIPLILTDNPANLPPLLHIAEGGQLISLNSPYSPDFFVYDGNGSLLFHKTLSAEKTPWVSSVTPVPEGTGVVVTQLVPGCCHGSVSNTSSNKVTFYDRSGRIVWDYVTYQPPLISTALPNTGDIIVGTEDGRIICLDRSGSVRWTTVVDAPVRSITASADGNTLVATGDSNYDSSIRYGESLSPYDLFFLDGTGEVLGKYQTRGENTVAVSRNGSVIAVIGGRFGNLMMFNRTGTMTGERSFPGAGTALFLSGDGTRLVMETTDGIVYTLDGELQETGVLPAGSSVGSVAFSSNGDIVALAENRTIKFTNGPGDVVGIYTSNSAIQCISPVPGSESIIACTDRALVFFNGTSLGSDRDFSQDHLVPARRENSTGPDLIPPTRSNFLSVIAGLLNITTVVPV